ncbi:MAG: DUF3567 domain-containing protein [Zoogloeaceae bacterium]|jgi:hypothetical protein|nr:DUF3567 domain-containing protein [Zoogloeaceae bacterium]
MNIVYDSTHYSVLAYPAQEGFELLDKDARRILFLQGAFAHHFYNAISDIPEAERTVEAIDAFLDNYCNGGASRPIVFH